MRRTSCACEKPAMNSVCFVVKRCRLSLTFSMKKIRPCACDVRPIADGVSPSTHIAFRKAVRRTNRRPYRRLDIHHRARLRARRHRRRGIRRALRRWLRAFWVRSPLRTGRIGKRLAWLAFVLFASSCDAATSKRRIPFRRRPARRR